MTTNDTPWIDDIARWFADGDNARRFAKVMGYCQTKVLTGSAGTLKSFVAGLKERSWKVEPGDLDDFKGFSLLSDYRRLHTLPNAREKVLLLVVDNRKGADSDLGEALAKIELPSKQTRTQAIAKDLHARLWHL